MKHLKKTFIFAVVVSLSMPGLSSAADEEAFLDSIQALSGQSLGVGHSAIWTLPLVATQYQPAQPNPAIQSALKAQQEGRFLDALIQLADAEKSVKAGTDAEAEIVLLRASFLLEGNQSQQAQEILARLFARKQFAPDALALAAMALLQQGKLKEAVDMAQHAQGLAGGVLPHLALSYALQGNGRLIEAHELMRMFNVRTPQSAIALAREAELSLTLNHTNSAKTLAEQARQMSPDHPYVIAVSGQAYLIEGDTQAARTAFQTALQRDPKDAKALLGMGLAEIKLGNFRGGLSRLQDAHEADPGNALVLTYLGRAQQQLGQAEAAMASWRKAQLADPKDPVPWLYQAQLELQNNQPMEARKSLREAQVRTTYRSVYRGARLLEEDEQLLRANQAETERQLGLENLAFHTLSNVSGEKTSASLRNQAELLQGEQFGESARRSLLLQSQFNDKPGNLPAELDVYGDGAGQTGATTPQHGVVSGLNAPQASYNNYDDLFNTGAKLEANAMQGNQYTRGHQVRVGLGNGTVGLGIAHRQFLTDGVAPFQNLDNHIWQGIVQWRPTESAQLFISHHTFDSRHGETRYPADPYFWGEYHQIVDRSEVSRLGLRYSLDDNSELRALFSRQQTSQTDDWEWIANTPPYSAMPCCGPELPFPQFTHYLSSQARSAELQYRRSGTGHVVQWGVSAVRSPLTGTTFNYSTMTNVAQQVYADWQQALDPHWQLEAGLAWGKNDKLFNAVNTSLRRWLPKVGVVYAPNDTTHVRFAAWKNLDDAAVGNASLAPSTLAGIALNRPGDTYKLVRGVALGADSQLGTPWVVEGKAQRRWTDEPYVSNGVQLMTPRMRDDARLALHWLPSEHAWGVTLAYDDERVWNDSTMIVPNSVIEQRLRSQQLGLRWRAAAQWTTHLTLSHNHLSALQQSSDVNFNPVQLGIQESFNQVDASLSWRYSQAVSVDVGVRNAANKSSQYTETDPLMPRFSKGRLGYARLRLAW